MRLDRWFKTHYATLPHSRLEKLLAHRAGAGSTAARAKASTRLAAGQSVRVPPLPDVAPPPGAEARAVQRPIAPSSPRSRSTRTTIFWCSTSRRASPCRAAPRPRITSTGCSRAWAMDRRRGPVSCIGSTATRLACWWSPSGARWRPSSAGPSRRARCARSIGRWCKGVPKPPQGKIEAALVKAVRARRRPRAQSAARRAGHRAVGGDPLRGGRQGRADGRLRVAQAGHRAAASAPRAYGHSSAIRSSAMRNITSDRELPPRASTTSCICTRGASASRTRRGRAWSTSPRRYPITCGRPSPPSASMRATTRATSMTMSDNGKSAETARIGAARKASLAKRFYKDVAIKDEDGGGASLLLDGKPVRTPGKAPLLLPTRALAEAIAEEWRGARRAHRSLDHAAHQARQQRHRRGRGPRGRRSSTISSTMPARTSSATGPRRPRRWSKAQSASIGIRCSPSRAERARCAARPRRRRGACRPAGSFARRDQARARRPRCIPARGAACA